jgi:hypothetical protein
MFSGLQDPDPLVRGRYGSEDPDPYQNVTDPQDWKMYKASVKLNLLEKLYTVCIR